MSRQELERKLVFLKRATATCPGGLYIAEELRTTVEELGLSCEEHKAAKAVVEERVLEVRWSVGKYEVSLRLSKAAHS